eukprot:gene1728-16212_t
MEKLREIVRQCIEKVCSSLNANNNIDFGDVSITVDLVVDAISFIDSVTRLPDDIYSDAVAARKSIEDASKMARVPLTYNGHQGRPSFGVLELQISFLLDLGFSVLQISSLLNVFTRKVERRIKFYSLMAREHSQIPDEALDVRAGEV